MSEDSAHVLRDPDFHDGYLTGIRVVDDSILELSCSTMDGEPHLLSLAGLDCLRADNFLQGNIVFEVAVFESDFPIELVKKALGIDNDERPTWLETQLEKMKQGPWTLLELSSSYGCELVAIGRGKLRIEKC